MRNMDKDKVEPPERLYGNVLMRIGQEERRRAKMFLFLSAQIALSSAFGIVFSVQYMLQGFYQSSFHTYFSLLLSDPDIVSTYWKEFTLSLADTIPFIGITISLITIAMLLVSVRVFVNNMRKGFSPALGN
jgi:hypothetical protein